MASVRGIPNTPKAPNYAEEPSGFRNRAARTEAQAQNAKLHEEYSIASMYEGQARSTYDKALNNSNLIGVKGTVPELAAAAQVRGKSTSGKAHDAYKNPTEYIADLWADGFIDDKKAHGLLTRLQQDGEIVPNTDEQRLLKDREAREEILAVEECEGVPGSQFSQGSARRLEQKYTREKVLIPNDQKMELSDDSTIGFLEDELKKRHISPDEHKVMLAWERKPERTQTTEELAALKQQVVQQMLAASPDMDKGQAALMALGVVQELRDPFTHQMNKLLADTAPARSETPPVDIGELQPVKQGGFSGRELQKRAAQDNGAEKSR